ncbi:MAG: methionyl-tRNA formyltransferase [Acidimicrobiia bacterium]
MRAVFLGTPAAAVPSLRALHGFAEVELVVTRPDRPRGRSGRPQTSEVGAAAADLGIPVSHPETAGDLQSELAAVGTFDVALVVAYGMLIRPGALGLPTGVFVNVHFSILPRWRGAAPVQRAILAGDSTSGVTLMRIDAGLDTGAILATTATRIGSREDAAGLTTRLAHLGARLVTDWLPAATDGRIAPIEQDDDDATIAAKLRSEERWIDVKDTSQQVVAAVRGLSPWPGAWVRHRSGGVRILDAEMGSAPLAPGDLVLESASLLMGTGNGSVRLVTVQPEGKRAMAAADWARGLRDSAEGVS